MASTHNSVLFDLQVGQMFHLSSKAIETWTLGNSVSILFGKIKYSFTSYGKLIYEGVLTVEVVTSSVTNRL